MRIWVIDDDRDICEALFECLTEEGHEVVTFNDGSQALMKLAHGEAPSVILLDMLMPGMPGHAFLEALGKEPSWDGIPVMLISASSHTKEHPRAAKVLRKPFDLIRLFDALFQTVSSDLVV